MNPYESERLLAEYLLFHYGGPSDVLGALPGPVEAVGFATRLVERLLDPGRLAPSAVALDVGCAVGASAFALSKSCASVLGIDYSHSFISAAEALAHNGELPARVCVEGNVTQPFLAKVPAGNFRERVQFETGDAMDLRAELEGFDVVLAANLLCRLPDPRVFLNRLPALVKPGGQLLLTTPFTWMEEYTPVANWIGGHADEARSAEVLQTLLLDHFDLVYQENIPFLIREHARKFQYSIAWGTRWIRK